MLDNYKTLPFIIGVSLILIFPIGIGTIAFSVLGNDGEGQETETTNSPAEDNPFDGLAREQNIKPAPIPPAEGNGGGGVGYDSSEGIPIGRYSNPPTRIETFGEDLPNTNRPINSSGSSVELNRWRQEREKIDSTIPDYSAPSSSNNFKSTEDNSPIDSLSDDMDMLEAPESETETENVPPALSPINEPLLGQ